MCFQKSESELGSSWILGMIAGIDRSRDGLIRKVVVKYRNASETQDRETERSVRKLCKLWSEDDWNLQDDLAELADRLKGVTVDQAIIDQVERAHLGVHHASAPPDCKSKPQDLADGCCCASHCGLIHGVRFPLRPYQALNNILNLACDLDPQMPSFKVNVAEVLDSVTPSVEPALDNLADFLLNFNII